MVEKIYGLMINFYKLVNKNYERIIEHYKKQLNKVNLDLRFIYNNQYQFYNKEELETLKLNYYNFESLNRIVGLHQNCVIIYKTEMTKYQILKLHCQENKYSSEALKNLQDDYIIEQLFNIFDNIVFNDYGFLTINSNASIYLDSILKQNSAEQKKVYDTLEERYRELINSINVDSYQTRYTNNFMLLKLFLDKILSEKVPIMDAYQEVYGDLIKFSNEFDDMDTSKPFDEKIRILEKCRGVLNEKN